MNSLSDMERLIGIAALLGLIAAGPGGLKAGLLAFVLFLTLAAASAGLAWWLMARRLIEDVVTMPMNDYYDPEPPLPRLHARSKTSRRFVLASDPGKKKARRVSRNHEREARAPTRGCPRNHP